MGVTFTSFYPNNHNTCRELEWIMRSVGFEDVNAMDYVLYTSVYLKQTYTIHLLCNAKPKFISLFSLWLQLQGLITFPQPSHLSLFPKLHLHFQMDLLFIFCCLWEVTMSDLILFDSDLLMLQYAMPWYVTNNGRWELN